MIIKSLYPIRIRQDKSILLKGKNSLFISFDYDSSIVNLVKQIPSARWNRDSKEWEVALNSIDDIIDIFRDFPLVWENLSVTTEKKAQFKKLDTNIMTPFEFKTAPLQHQLEGFNYAKDNPCFLLGDEQGLGKTKQIIDIAVSRKNQFKHCLIIAGVNSLKWNWLEEIEKHSNERGYLLGSVMKKGVLREGSVKERLKALQNIEWITDFFIVTNLETIRNEEIQVELKRLCRMNIIGMVAIDEIHKAKNPNSSQGKAIHALQSYYKIGASGTPLMNTPLDLYNPLKWLGVERHSYYQFTNHYAIKGSFNQINGYRNLNELKTLLESCQLRRLKSEVLDLPPKIYINEYVEMGKQQWKIYNEVRDWILQNIDLILASPNPLAELIRLRQATGYTGVLSSGVRVSAKIDRLMDIIEERLQANEQVVVFSNWEKTLLPAYERFKVEFRMSAGLITGKTSDRMAEVHDFQEGVNKVIFGTVGAMGTGLTLTAGTVVVFLDEPWNRANKEQAEDRCHRIGTIDSVKIITLLSKDTIDERIHKIVLEKGAYADLIVDGKVNVRSLKSACIELLK